MRAPFRLLLLALALPLSLGAQRVRAPSNDALTLPAGWVIVGIGGEHTTFRDAWFDGRLVPLGGAFSGALDATRLSRLGSVQSDVRALGVTGFGASLGTSSLDLRRRMFVTPLSLAYGATSWLTIGARAPLVRTRSEGLHRLDGSSATLGVNPYFVGSGVAASNQATIDRYAAAAASLQARRDGCIANPGSAPECPTILAEQAQVNALIGITGGFATGLTRVYGGTGLTRPSAYVPLAGSTAEQALLARRDSLRTAMTRYGVTDITATTGLPLGAQAPLGAADLDAMMRDSLDGFGARRLASSAAYGIGDVEINAKVRLFDSFRRGPRTRFNNQGFAVRQSIAIDYRLGTGAPPAPGDFLDIGTGTGESAIGVRSFTDVAWNEKLWATVMVGYAKGTSSEVRLRAPTYGTQRMLEAWRELDARVTRRPLYLIDVTPSWILNDYVAIGGNWSIRHKSQDEFELPASVQDPSGTTVLLTQPITASREQRIGLHATFSTIAAYDAKRVKQPFEISWLHQQSLSSEIGLTPKRWEDRLQFRYYARVFGR